MIINDSNKIIYLGNGATKEWPFSFSITQASDIKVSLVNLDGEILNISSDYYVDVTNKKVLYPGYVPGQEPSQAEQPPILPTGWKIIIYRSVPVTQETDLGANWPFNMIEESLDKLTMIVQDQKEQIDRSVKVDMNSEVSAQALIDSVFTAKNSAETAAASAQTALESVESTAAQTLIDIATEKNSSITAIRAETINAIDIINPLVSAAESSATNSANSATEAEISKQKAYEYAQNPGIPIGFTYTVDYTELQSGQLALLGGKYLKSTFADLWEWVQTHPSLIKTETEWQAISTASGGRAVPYYSNVDDQYFRVPLVTTWVRGASRIDEVGVVLEAGLPNILGSMGYIGNSDVYTANGAFTEQDGLSGGSFGGSNQRCALNFDASKSNSIYGKSTTVQPQSIIQLWVVQAFGTASNVGNMDVAQVVKGITDVQTRVSMLESDTGFKIIDETIVSTLSNIAINSRCVLENPFLGYEVICRAEVLCNGMWGDAGYTSGTSSTTYGVHASVINNDKIVIQTGANALVAYSGAAGNGFGITSNVVGPLPCRVKVWKVGKIS